MDYGTVDRQQKKHLRKITQPLPGVFLMALLFRVTAPLTKTSLQIQKLIREVSSGPNSFDHCRTVMWFHLHYKQVLMKNKGNESSYQSGNLVTLPHAFTFQLLSRCHYTEHFLPLHTCI